jgi:hypothetical protein
MGAHSYLEETDGDEQTSFALPTLFLLVPSLSKLGCRFWGADRSSHLAITLKVSMFCWGSSKGLGTKENIAIIAGYEGSLCFDECGAGGIISRWDS